MAKKQKETKYKPTVAQQRLLEVLLNPEHRLKYVTEICAIASCGRKVYYNAFKNQDFVDHYMSESKRMISKAYAGIINASIRQALRGDATHAKMLLNMTGDYVDKMAFPDKHGNPQPVGTTINNNTVLLNPLERATRIAFILQKAIEYKKKVEESEKKQGDKEKQGS
jgi:hypothetical protein